MERQRATLKEKIMIMDFFKNSNKPQKETVKHFQEKYFISTSSFSEWMRNESELRARYNEALQLDLLDGVDLTKSKRKSTYKYAALNEAMQKWVTMRMKNGLPVNDPILRKEWSKIAKDHGITDSKRIKNFSHGWLANFKKRKGINYSTDNHLSSATVGRSTSERDVTRHSGSENTRDTTCGTDFFQGSCTLNDHAESQLPYQLQHTLYSPFQQHLQHSEDNNSRRYTGNFTANPSKPEGYIYNHLDAGYHNTASSTGSNAYLENSHYTHTTYKSTPAIDSLGSGFSHTTLALLPHLSSQYFQSQPIHPFKMVDHQPPSPKFNTRQLTTPQAYLLPQTTAEQDSASVLHSNLNAAPDQSLPLQVENHYGYHKPATHKPSTPSLHSFDCDCPPGAVEQQSQMCIPKITTPYDLPPLTSLVINEHLQKESPIDGHDKPNTSEKHAEYTHNSSMLSRGDLSTSSPIYAATGTAAAPVAAKGDAAPAVDFCQNDSSLGKKYKYRANYSSHQQVRYHVQEVIRPRDIDVNIDSINNMDKYLDMDLDMKDLVKELEDRLFVRIDDIFSKIDQVRMKSQMVEPEWKVPFKRSLELFEIFKTQFRNDEAHYLSLDKCQQLDQDCSNDEKLKQYQE
jgi:hypothetical protein